MKRAFTLVDAVIVLAIVLFLAVILFPVFMRNERPRWGSCQSHLKQIGLGFLQYTQDAADTFPPTGTTDSTSWADVIQPYIKSTAIFQCGSTQNHTLPLTDYFYNSRVAGVQMSAFELTAQTILTGDGADDAPTWASLSQLPASWKSDRKSPSRRHFEGTANYGFADGHVKWFKPARVNSKFSDKGYPTFALAKSP